MWVCAKEDSGPPGVDLRNPDMPKIHVCMRRANERLHKVHSL